ncbi:hypothetical protein DK843_22595 (plasmid) [Chromobacterium phragmitis]|uniref:Uncharacterized protein n=1 Tax=Chromobacterium phragmitis TaxID=2202141 RepID=A0A344UPE5_9NEIS|nr:hypothetical protein DK843_22595 [Chromobacterium phragmitis]
MRRNIHDHCLSVAVIAQQLHRAAARQPLLFWQRQRGHGIEQQFLAGETDHGIGAELPGGDLRQEGCEPDAQVGQILASALQLGPNRGQAHQVASGQLDAAGQFLAQHLGAEIVQLCGGGDSLCRQNQFTHHHCPYSVFRVSGQSAATSPGRAGVIALVVFGGGCCSGQDRLTASDN